MKKFLLLMISVMPLSAIHADEGMWMLYNLPDAIYSQMVNYGFSLPKSALYSDSTALKNSVVNFSGYCTGEVVSPDGLVLTNHHCGFESVRYHSTVEHDYMLNGFCAHSYEEELPNNDMFVAFMKEQRDITPMLEEHDFWNLSVMDRQALIDSIEIALNGQLPEDNPSLYIEVTPFYEGNAYYATTYQQYSDVRLVFAPPKSLGKFGGETDNWMWPRQTCDFTVFRIYGDPETGAPAPYSKKNKPIHTANHLQISMNGYRNDDFAMTIGYPGSTERYLSSYGIREMRDCVNDPTQQVRGIKQRMMKKYMDRSEDVRIKYDSKYSQSSNYWKNAIGMNKCIDSTGIIRQKQEYEQRIARWVESTGNFKGQLDLKILDTLYAHRAEAMRAQTLFTETFTHRSNNELAVRATRFYNGTSNNSDDNDKSYITYSDNSEEWDRDLDIAVMTDLIDNFRDKVPEKYLPDFYKEIEHKYFGDIKSYVTDIWDKSAIMKNNVRIPARMTRKLSRDIGVQFSMSLAETMASLRMVLDTLEESIIEQERLLCAAKLRMEQDMPHYSDANSTMRLSYGQIKEYRIGKYNSGHYTTAPSIVSKMEKGNEIEDYKAEPEIQQLMQTADFGNFADRDSKSLNLCFLSTNDITGGNSGSPVIDKNGRLIGLAFDGNWDSLSSDIFFDKTLTRCISVDIRYVLYIIKEWGKADHLLKEMGITTE